MSRALSLELAVFFACLTAAPSLPAQDPLPDQAVILQYHHVSEATPPVTSISAADFRVHLEYLREQGFEVLRLEDVVRALREHDSLPERSAVITFDDGYRNVYETAFPLLREFGWPFTVFVTSGLVDSNAALYANWDQLREMAAAGATLANHSVSHPYLLERLEDEDETAWLARIEGEILTAEAEIEQRTGQSHKLFAYPYGEYEPRIQALVARLGFTGIGQHSGPINASSDFTALPRFPFSGIYASMNSFPTKVRSLAFDLHLVSPDSPVTDSPRPEAVLEFTGSYRFDALACYNNSEPMRVSVEAAAQGRYRVIPLQDNRSRRFRYNCTAPGPQGRYYWYSIPWVNPTITE